MTINCINPEEIDEYLLSFAGDSYELAVYLDLALKKALLKKPELFRQVYDFSETRPHWMTEEMSWTGTFHKFIPSKAHAAGISRTIDHIRDWIGGAMESNDAWLKEVDAQGRPLKLLRIGTLEQATNMADKDMRRKANILRSQFINAAEAFDEEERYEHIGVVREFDNGCKIVRLYSAEALDRESAFLGHCIGNGNYDSKLKEKGVCYYSLRDPLNKPHATFEVKDGVLTQLKGKQNEPPVRKYMVMAQEFIREKKWKLFENPANTGLLYQNGEYYDVQNLPEDFTWRGTIDLSGAKWLKHLPKNLSVLGNLTIIDCNALTSLSDNLFVDGDLVVQGCKNLKMLSPDLAVKGDLTVKDCHALTYFADSLRVGNSLNVGCSYYKDTDLKRLAGVLTVGKRLCIEHQRGLVGIASEMNVGGHLEIYYCGTLIEMPDKVRVRGNVFTQDKTYFSFDVFQHALAKARSGNARAISHPSLQM